jgi:hypothetical protein
MTIVVAAIALVAWIGTAGLFKSLVKRSRYKIGSVFFLKHSPELHATILEIKDSEYLCQMRIVGYNGRVTDKSRSIPKKIFEAKYERIL